MTAKVADEIRGEYRRLQERADPSFGYRAYYLAEVFSRMRNESVAQFVLREAPIHITEYTFADGSKLWCEVPAEDTPYDVRII